MARRLGGSAVPVVIEFTAPKGTTSIDRGSWDGWGVDSRTLTYVTIPTTVESIGEFAFYKSSALVKVSIPNSVKSIGNNAFSECIALEEAAIPTSVESIGFNAFFGCRSLEKVAIPTSVESIGDHTFCQCRSLEKVAIPTSVKSIGQGAFLGCSALLKVTIPASVKLIGPKAFMSCQALVEVAALGSVESIGWEVFYGCRSLVKVTIPASVKCVGYSAFRDCRTLVGVTVPGSVESIGNNAFRDCRALVGVTIPTSVESIGAEAFYGCFALVKVTIPTSVKAIGQGAFFGCSALVEVAIPLNSVESIRPEAFENCHTDLVLTLGEVADIDAPNRFPGINGVARCATLVHQLPGAAGCCVVRCVWPASTVELPKQFPYDAPTHAATEPGLPALVDGTGIVQPLQLQTLAGDEYMVYGCWGKDPVAHPDFKSLAAEQHPEALGNTGSWDVLLHNTDVAAHTLDLAAVGDAVVRGEVDLSEPVLVVWTQLEDAEGSDQRSEESAATAARLKRPRGDAFELGEDMRSSRRPPSEPAP